MFLIAVDAASANIISHSNTLILVLSSTIHCFKHLHCCHILSYNKSRELKI